VRTGWDYDAKTRRYVRTDEPTDVPSIFAERRTPPVGSRVVRIETRKRHPQSERLHELLREIGELHDRKQRDYGTAADPFANVRASEEFGVSAWVGAIVRMNDKVTRLKQYARRGNLANESAADSLKDIAVYALIALVLLEQDTAPPVS
jgi:hypothetical protein